MKRQQEVLNRKLIAVITAVIIAVSAVFGAVMYLLDYYPAEASDEISQGSVSVSVIDYGDGVIAYEPGYVSGGIIFYPESRVEYKAYENLMASIASRGFLCLLVEMPLNQPSFGMNEAIALEMRYPDITKWYMCGHGSGAKTAAAYASRNTDIFSGVILLGGHTSADLRDTGLNVISVYGSEDKVMSMGSYERSKNKMPADYAELVIEGGCHSYFGSYGIQNGDGTPTITMTEQLKQTADFINSNFK
ncbi:MAG: alpha/beta hydrolase [Oscillospiraceae bacterium]|nr:alpha/beta hydrolase [Oscillospiraceae bacterium]